ncbi:MAG: PhoPQ-activated pathogenicity protein [Pirellulales bacterium]|nr:PhoPQ-activated pathogenicity protein [Pirellulales bacterium]
MRIGSNRFAAIVCLSIFMLPLVAAAKKTVALPNASPALADYVKQPDSSYQWHVKQRGKVGAGDYVELILTSQTWHDIVWKHQLFIYRPAKVRDAAQSLLLIDGGNWSDSLEKAPDASQPAELPERVRVLALLADMIQAPIAVVRQVPNQPIFDGKKEDQIIALTFSKYFETGQSDWPLLLPMVKSAVRAMDTVQEFSKQEWKLDVQKFLVTGASKRGWTTWLTAASDPRVDGLAPMVINMLNMLAHDELQLKSFGTYSEQIRDYTDRRLQDYLHSEKGAALRAIVDPIAYRTHLTQPKLIILATNDAYWPADALNNYWKDLQGDKYILYVPNNGHGIQDYPRVVATIAALERSLAGQKPMPRLEWRLDEKSNPPRLELTSDKPPLAVRQWSATADTRDFRKSLWQSSPVSAESGDAHKFAVDMSAPQKGFGARFLEAEFAGDPLPFVLTTTLHVLGDSEPANAAAGGGGE